jgi:hypothetical protein
MLLITGGSFCEFTVNVKLVLADSPAASITVTVIGTEPCSFGNGSKLNVNCSPVLTVTNVYVSPADALYTVIHSALCAIIEIAPELTVTVKGSLSASDTVNPTGVMALSSSVV